MSRAVERRYEPTKMNWLHLGNGVPHLHVHLVPRPFDDPNAGGPVEAEDFEQSRVVPLGDDRPARRGCGAALGPGRLTARRAPHGR